jgi:hypothetical protein
VSEIHPVIGTLSQQKSRIACQPVGGQTEYSMAVPYRHVGISQVYPRGLVRDASLGAYFAQSQSFPIESLDQKRLTFAGKGRGLATVGISAPQMPLAFERRRLMRRSI